MTLARRLTLVLGCGQLLSWSTSFYLPAVIAAAAAESLGASRAEILGGFSWALLTAGACAPLVGRRIDAAGGRGVMAASCLAIAAGLSLLATAQGLVQWYLGWSVLGIGMALGLYDAAFASIGRLLGRAGAPAITGVTLFAGFASTLGWPAGSLLLDGIGWRATLLLYAGLQLAVTLPLYWFGIPADLPPPAAHSPPTPGESRVRRTALGCLAGFFALRWFLTSAVAVFILPLLAGLGLTLSQRLLVAGLIGPGQVAGRLLEWRVGPRFGLLLRARLGAALMPLGILVLLLGGPIPACVFAVLYGMSNGILTINRGTLPLALFGPAGYASLLGWLAVPALLATAGAPILVAPLVDLLSPRTVFALAAGLSGLAILLLLPLRLADRSAL